jgi:hypothetical protein
METYNLNPDLLKEHLVDVQFNPKKIDYFQSVPSNIKAQITRLYNNRHKSSLKSKKKGRTAVSGGKLILKYINKILNFNCHRGVRIRR